MKTKLSKIIASFLSITIILSSFSPLINISSVNANSTIDENRYLKFNAIEKSVSIGKSLRISPSRKGINTKAEMTWTSSNPSVAIVNEKGTVTGVTRGTSTITVNCDGLSASYSVSVTPNKPKILTDEGSIISTLVVAKDDEKNLTFQDEFSSISNDEVEWKSNKETVCSVDQNGKIKALTNGTATITAMLKSNPKIKSTLRVSVATPVEAIEMKDESVVTYVGESVTIEYNVLPETAANSRVKFEVEDKTIATASNTGKITGKSVGNTKAKITSISNPEVISTIDIEVREQREYAQMSVADIVNSTNSYNYASILSDGTYRVDKNSIISIPNTFGKDVKFKNNDQGIIKITGNDENYINVQGLKDGIGTIIAEYDGMQTVLKVTVGDYIDKSVLSTNRFNSNVVSVQKLKAGLDPDDDTKDIDLVNDYPLEVGVGYDLSIRVSPINASASDLVAELKDTKNFTFENGKVKALTPNKTTELVITSRSNAKIKLNIKLKSSIGNVKEIRFAKDYVGEYAFDINKYKSYGFNPVFVMESGQTYDPVANPEIVDTDVYKELKKNIKITCDDKDVVDIYQNGVKLKKGVNGTGILKMEYDKTKNARSTEYSADITAEARFEAIGKVAETIKKIRFVKNNYELAPGQGVCFNPIFEMSEGTKYDPTEEGVADSDEYKQLLKEVGLMNGSISGQYVDATSLLNFHYLDNGNSDNTIEPIYEGKCKIKMVVHSNNDISDETIIEIKSPYVLKNQEQGLKISKEYKKTMYVNTDELKIVEDTQGNGESGKITRGTAIWAFEKYSNGYMRVAYNGNENLYVEAKYLAEKKEQTEKKKSTSSSSSSSSSSNSSSSNSSSSSSSSSNSSSQNVDRGKVTKQNKDKIVDCDSLTVRSRPIKGDNKIDTLSKGAMVVQVDSDSNGWSKVEYDGRDGYVATQYLKDYKKSTNKSNNMSSSSSGKVISANEIVGIHWYRYAKKRTSIYSKRSASRNYLVRTINAGTQLFVDYKDKDGKWAFVTQPVKGYVWADDLRQ